MYPFELDVFQKEAIVHLERVREERRATQQRTAPQQSVSDLSRAATQPSCDAVCVWLVGWSDCRETACSWPLILQLARLWWQSTP